MKTLSALLLLIMLTGCERRSTPATTSVEKPEIEWNDAKYSIEDYKRMQPRRPILAIFTHKWDIPIVKLWLKKKEVMDLLKENTFLCLNYESTAPDSIGQIEMKKLGRESYPQAFVSIPNLGDSLHTPGYSEEEWLAFVNKISKDAELAGRSDGGKPPKWGGGPPAGWTALEAPLEQYVARNPGKPIIVAFGAKWGAVSIYGWRILSSEGVTEALQDAGFVCVAADLTKGNELATNEMRRLGREALPVTAVYDPTIGKWEPKALMFSSADVLNWATLLKKRIAEQPADGKTPQPSQSHH